MKRPIIAALLVLSMTLETPAAEQTHSEMDVLREMRLTAQSQGIAGFLAKANDEHWRAPHLYSAYWVDKLPPDQAERAKLEKERRRFGAALAAALDDAASKLVRHDLSAQRRTQVEQMLAIAQWVRTEPGYGNLLLFNRAQNLAAIPFAHLIADTAYPLEDLQQLKLRFVSESQDLDFRVLVLNDEAPATFTVTKSSSVREQQEQLELSWNGRWKEMMNWAETNSVRSSSQNKSLRERLPPALAFYCDDEGISGNPPRTAARLWEMKRHMPTCIYGTRDNVVGQALQLLLVREQLGVFPTNPPSWYKSGDNWTPTQAAFEKAWQPYENSHGNIAFAAASTFEVIKADRFMDWETSELLERNAAAPGL